MSSFSCLWWMHSVPLPRGVPLTPGLYRMVMGFNTNIERDGVIYHVETELRKGEGIETTVYAGGAVIHKTKSSCYQDLPNSPHSDEDMLRRAIEDQHRQVIARVRSGEFLPPSSSVPFRS